MDRFKKKCWLSSEKVFAVFYFSKFPAT